MHRRLARRLRRNFWRLIFRVGDIRRRWVAVRSSRASRGGVVVERRLELLAGAFQFRGGPIRNDPTVAVARIRRARMESKLCRVMAGRPNAPRIWLLLQSN